MSDPYKALVNSFRMQCIAYVNTINVISDIARSSSPHQEKTHPHPTMAEGSPAPPPGSPPPGSPPPGSPPVPPPLLGPQLLDPSASPELPSTPHVDYYSSPPNIIIVWGPIFYEIVTRFPPNTSNTAFVVGRKGTQQGAVPKSTSPYHPFNMRSEVRPNMRWLVRIG
ncbi:12683_t:CDS:2 [Dentiscutata heterogama]|uniref:12683_t:CDS:1 n=1 Tax=Dentiscutata heterogama TaxID=1316150 RepID=A0ACA9PCJ9_9GLOM|nr:12683_t:CDS:2 [Dentiscutata heterogama]